mgnify:CR=1 FL=1
MGKKKQRTPHKQNIPPNKNMGGKRLSPRRAAGPRNRSDVAGCRVRGPCLYSPQRPPAPPRVSRALTETRHWAEYRQGPTEPCERQDPAPAVAWWANTYSTSHSTIPSSRREQVGNTFGTGLEHSRKGPPSFCCGGLPRSFPPPSHDTRFVATGSDETFSGSVPEPCRETALKGCHGIAS